jgi:L-lactate dehydrogenase complex protein LldG
VTSREEIFKRIAQAKVTPVVYERLPAEPSKRFHSAILDQFVEYVEEYRATVHRVTAPELPNLIAQLHLASPTAVPSDLPARWVQRLTQVLRDENMSLDQLDGCGSVVTGCAVAIAETGTIVLDSGFAQGPRRLTLVPDHHVVVVFESQVVDSVPEAVTIIGPAIAEGRPLTWISGPSATSDIELSRVEGVHGPRRLDVLLVRQ